ERNDRQAPFSWRGQMGAARTDRHSERTDTKRRERRSRVNVTGRITEIVVDPTSPSTIYVATAGGGVWKTVDGGVTWSPVRQGSVARDRCARDGALGPQPALCRHARGQHLLLRAELPAAGLQRGLPRCRRAAVE